MIHSHHDFEGDPLDEYDPAYLHHFERDGRWLALYFAACLIAIAWAGIYFIA